MNTTPPTIFFYNAVIATSGETGFLYEMGGIAEVKMKLGIENYSAFFDELGKLVIDGYKKIGGNFDPEKHRVVFRSLSRLQ